MKKFGGGGGVVVPIQVELILFSSFLFGASLIFVLLFFIVVLSSFCVISFIFLFVKFVLSLFRQSGQVKKTSGGVSDHRFIQKLAKTKT